MHYDRDMTLMSRNGPNFGSIKPVKDRVIILGHDSWTSSAIKCTPCSFTNKSLLKNCYEFVSGFSASHFSSKHPHLSQLFSHLSRSKNSTVRPLASGFRIEIDDFSFATEPELSSSSFSFIRLRVQITWSNIYLDHSLQFSCKNT